MLPRTSLKKAAADIPLKKQFLRYEEERTYIKDPPRNGEDQKKVKSPPGML